MMQGQYKRSEHKQTNSDHYLKEPKTVTYFIKSLNKLHHDAINMNLINAILLDIEHIDLKTVKYHHYLSQDNITSTFNFLISKAITKIKSSIWETIEIKKADVLKT